ncbi:MAG TPA: NAD(P)-dependent oxidoreductase [Nitrososphaera sp.]|nr:NAD(P)-dependent oxidoreductase [Nitrososphaera sp.]
MKIGVAGLGLMGSAIASRIAAEGFELAVFNRDSKKAEQFSGATVARTPAELGTRCDLVITVVTDFDALQSILFGNDGLASSGNKNLLVIDASTISPLQSEHCARALRENGMQMLGMPVMGGPSAAEAGELVPMVAGPKDAYDKAKPAIDALGKTVFYVGEKDGAANVIKLALNLNIALIASAVSEGIALVRSHEIDASLFVRILNSTYFRTGLSEKKGPKMATGDFEPSFHLKNMLKDLELAAGAAQSGKIALPQTSLAAQLFRAANNSGYADSDYTAICGFLAKINGLRLDR